jgi:nitrogen regulatory protein PII
LGQNDRPEAAKLLLSVVNRGQGAAVLQVYSQYAVPWHYQTLGEGTASSELLDVLGFGGTERDVLLSLGTKNAVDRLMGLLREDYPETLKATGIACDLSLTAMNNIVATALTQAGQGIGQTGGTTMGQSTHSLIIITVNQGHTDEVMNTARAAGARGGTILRARYAGQQEKEPFFGITVQAEQEILLIVATADTRNAIMETVNKKHGLKSQAGAVIFSAPLDHVVRLHGD